MKSTVLRVYEDGHFVVEGGGVGYNDFEFSESGLERLERMLDDMKQRITDVRGPDYKETRRYIVERHGGLVG